MTSSAFSSTLEAIATGFAAAVAPAAGAFLAAFFSFSAYSKVNSVSKVTDTRFLNELMIECLTETAVGYPDSNEMAATLFKALP